MMFVCGRRGCRESFTEEVTFELGPRDQVGVCQTQSGRTVSQGDSVSGDTTGHRTTPSEKNKGSSVGTGKGMGRWGSRQGVGCEGPLNSSWALGICPEGNGEPQRSPSRGCGWEGDSGCGGSTGGRGHARGREVSYKALTIV